MMSATEQLEHLESQIAALQQRLGPQAGWADEPMIVGATRGEWTCTFYELVVFSMPAMDGRAAFCGWESTAARGLARRFMPLETGEAATFREARMAGQMALGRAFARAAIAAERDAERTHQIGAQIDQELSDAR
jgi:hypothetical protein